MSTKLLGAGSRSSGTPPGAIPPGALGLKDSSRRKHRCWRFHVSKLAGGGYGGGRREVDVLPPFRKKYTSVKRLVLNTTSEEEKSESNSDVVETAAASDVSAGGESPVTRSICIEVEFAGPQPSQGPGALLCELLSGTSVEAKPVHLERGRKKKTKAVLDAGSTSPESKNTTECEGDVEKRGSDTVSPTSKAEKKRGDRDGEGRNSDGDENRNASSSTVKSRKSRSVSIKDGKAATNCHISSDNDSDTPPINLVGNSEDDASVPEAIEPIVVDEQQDYDDADPSSAEPSSPVRKRLRTFNVDRLRCTIDRMSIVDSDSEGDESSQPESDLSSFMDNNCGNWAGEALDATLSPLDEAPLLRGWSAVDSSSLEDEGSCSAAGRDSFGSLMDAHQDLMLFIDGESPVGVTTMQEPSVAAARVHLSTGEVEASPARLGEEELEATEVADFSGSAKKDDEVSVLLTRKDCDFMGRAEASQSSSDGDSGLHTIIFSGLGLDESVGPGVETLTAKAHFWIHSMHSVPKEAGTFQVASDGSVRATLRYPSMGELSPVLNEAINIRVVEVDMMVMVRSQNGDVKYASNNMKVTYRRPAWSTDASGRYPRAVCRRISCPSSPENERPGSTETAI